MGTAGLCRALERGAPLVAIVAQLCDGIDFAAATEEINAVADDFDLHPGDWYARPGYRIGSATKEALVRLLGWHLVRVALDRYDEESGTWGKWPNTFRWEELDEPRLSLFPLHGLIESIGSTQPGADDDGQWYE